MRQRHQHDQNQQRNEKNNAAHAPQPSPEPRPVDHSGMKRLSQFAPAFSGVRTWLTAALAVLPSRWQIRGDRRACKGECVARVADHLGLLGEPHLVCRGIVHSRSSVLPPHRADDQSPAAGEVVAVPDLPGRVASELVLQMRGEKVVPASRVPELPRHRVKAQPNAPCELLG